MVVLLVLRRPRRKSAAWAAVLWTALILSGLACARVWPGAKANESVTPEIVRVVPATGPAGVAYPLRVTLEGRHFADSANTVTFGPLTLRGLSSSDGGTRIVLHVPKEVPSTGEAPPAVLQPGSYRITVITVAGESNAAAFQLTPEPGGAR